MRFRGPQALNDNPKNPKLPRTRSHRRVAPGVSLWERHRSPVQSDGVESPAHPASQSHSHAATPPPPSTAPPPHYIHRAYRHSFSLYELLIAGVFPQPARELAPWFVTLQSFNGS